MLSTIVAFILSSPPPQPESYAEAVASLEAAVTSLSEDPTIGGGDVATALLALLDHAPQLAADRETLALRVDAMLQLARLHLNQESPSLAAATMDEIIRQAHGDALPAASYGPGLAALHRERLDAMNEQGTAEIEVICMVRCRVYIDGHEEPILSGPLHLGSHHVWIEDVSGVQPSVRSVEMLSVAGETRKLTFGRAPEPPPGPPSPPARRLAPLWAEITLVAVGAALIIGGGTALALHQPCAPLLPLSCDGFDARPLGVALMGVGGVSLGAGSVLLSVERPRGLADESVQASIGWQMRF